MSKEITFLGYQHMDTKCVNFLHPSGFYWNGVQYVYVKNLSCTYSVGYNKTVKDERVTSCHVSLLKGTVGKTCKASKMTLTAVHC